MKHADFYPSSTLPFVTLSWLMLLVIALTGTLLMVSPPAFAAVKADAHHQHLAMAPTPKSATKASDAVEKADSATPALNVYKSPTCGCCTLWVDHMDANGFSSNIHHPDDLNQVKEKYGIAPKFQSCHTAVTAEGFVFEGHIPAAVIKRFLAEKPKGAIGLAVPGMPVGSPGMEMGTRFSPYDVLLLKKDGSSSVYTRITSLDQFSVQESGSNKP